MALPTKRKTYRYNPTFTHAKSASDDGDAGRSGCGFAGVLLLVVLVGGAIVGALYLVDALPNGTSPLDPPDPPPYVPPAAANGTLIPLLNFSVAFTPGCAVWIPGSSWLYVCDLTNKNLRLYSTESVSGTIADQNYTVTGPSNTRPTPNLALASDDGQYLFVYFTGFGLAVYSVYLGDGSLTLYNVPSYSPTAIAMAYDGGSDSLFVTGILGVSGVAVFSDYGFGIGFLYQSNAPAPEQNTALVVVGASLYGVTSDYISQWLILPLNQTNATLSEPTFFYTHYTSDQGTPSQLFVSGDGSTIYPTSETEIEAWAVDPTTGALTSLPYFASAISLCTPVGKADYLYLANATGITEFTPTLALLDPYGVSAQVSGSFCSLLVLFDNELVVLVDTTGRSIQVYGVSPIW